VLFEALPPGIADRAGLKEEASLGAGERGLLRRSDAAALHDVVRRGAPGRVVTAVLAHGHTPSLAALAHHVSAPWLASAGLSDSLAHDG